MEALQPCLLATVFPPYVLSLAFLPIQFTFGEISCLSKTLITTLDLTYLLALGGRMQVYFPEVASTTLYRFTGSDELHCRHGK